MDCCHVNDSADKHGDFKEHAAWCAFCIVQLHSRTANVHLNSLLFLQRIRVF